MTTTTDFQPYLLHGPLTTEVPLLCDSPHSGMSYPADFNVVLAMSQLRQGEDTYVDELWKALPQYGATLLAANFPRTYIDPNRDVDDLDVQLLCPDQQWPHPLNPTEKTRIGYGLIWKSVRNQPIYNRCLTTEEIKKRIETYYKPYHQALAQHADTLYQRYGGLWHINLHSMPSSAYEGLGLAEKELADFVLGDRDGTTCSDAFITLVETFLRDEGYSVARNDPYKGVALIQRMGQPNKNKHSLQIEIKRPLYMNEVSFEKTTNFTHLQKSLSALSKEVSDYVRSQL